MIIEWSDFALEDLEDIKHYIAKDSPYYARELLNGYLALRNVSSISR
jgi:plasmid stabilization system protein ParE